MEQIIDNVTIPKDFDSQKNTILNIIGLELSKIEAINEILKSEEDTEIILDRLNRDFK